MMKICVFLIILYDFLTKYCYKIICRFLFKKDKIISVEEYYCYFNSLTFISLHFSIQSNKRKWFLSHFLSLQNSPQPNITYSLLFSFFFIFIFVIIFFLLYFLLHPNKTLYIICTKLLIPPWAVSSS